MQYMNLLAVDIGNTDIKFGIFENGVPTKQWRATGSRTHPEKFSALLRDSLARAGAHFDALVYTSVVPDIESVFRKTIQYCYQIPDRAVLAIQPGAMRLPLDMGKYPLDQLGMDRLVNACSARLLWPDINLIVVDMGTATTFDLVSADGRYLGGAITPGLYTFRDSLPEKTAKLPVVDLDGKMASEIHIGTNTMECMEAGLGFGYRGLMKELLRASAKELETSEYMVIGTGGLSDTVLRLCGLEAYFHILDPMLTLKGLHLLYEYNRGPVKV